MTRRNKWRRMARAWCVDYHSELRGQLTVEGLCAAMSHHWIGLHGDRVTFEKVAKEFYGYHTGGAGRGKYLCWSLCDYESRCLFACLMSNMSEEDYADFLKEAA